MLRTVEQFNGREAKTATLFRLLTCLCFCPRHFNRSTLSGEIQRMTLLKREIKLIIAVFALLFLCSVGSVFAQKKSPQFKDYPVTAIYTGKNAPLKLKRGDKLEREELQWAIDNQKIDFAGHYIVAGWSCGMWCNLNPIIDAKTGKVYWWSGILSVCFPDLDKDFTCNENFSNVEYKIDSRLVVFFGYRNGEAGSRGFHYYKFENGRFIHLKSVLVKEQRSQTQLLDKAGEKTNKNKNPEK